MGKRKNYMRILQDSEDNTEPQQHHTYYGRKTGVYICVFLVATCTVLAGVTIFMIYRTLTPSIHPSQIHGYSKRLQNEARHEMFGSLAHQGLMLTYDKHSFESLNQDQMENRNNKTQIKLRSSSQTKNESLSGQKQRKNTRRIRKNKPENEVSAVIYQNESAQKKGSDTTQIPLNKSGNVLSHINLRQPLAWKRRRKRHGDPTTTTSTPAPTTEETTAETTVWTPERCVFSGSRIGYYYPARGMCYYPDTTILYEQVGNGWIFDHPGASEFCEWYGGGLIQHSDQEVVDFIIESDMMEGSVTSFYWIYVRNGLLADIVPTSWFYWNSSQYDVNVDAVAANIDDGHRWWSFDAFSEDFHLICQKQVVCPHRVFDPEGENTCFYMPAGNTTLTWNHAYDFCNRFSSNSRIMRIDSLAKLQFLESLDFFQDIPDTSGYWIGFKKMLWSYYWEGTLDNVNSGWTNWATSPGSEKAGIAYKGRDNKWYTVEENSPHALVICEIPGIPGIGDVEAAQMTTSVSQDTTTSLNVSQDTTTSINVSQDPTTSINVPQDTTTFINVSKDPTISRNDTNAFSATSPYSTSTTITTQVLTSDNFTSIYTITSSIGTNDVNTNETVSDVTTTQLTTFMNITTTVITEHTLNATDIKSQTTSEMQLETAETMQHMSTLGTANIATDSQITIENPQHDFDTMTTGNIVLETTTSAPQCNPVPTWLNIHLSPTTPAKWGQTSHYSCRSGYIFEDGAVTKASKCSSQSGLWSPEFEKCIEIIDEGELERFEKPTEAKQAKLIGSFAFIFLTVEAIIISLLDMTHCCMCFGRIRRFCKRRLSRVKKQEDMDNPLTETIKATVNGNQHSVKEERKPILLQGVQDFNMEGYINDVVPSDKGEKVPPLLNASRRNSKLHCENDANGLALPSSYNDPWSLNVSNSHAKTGNSCVKIEITSPCIPAAEGNGNTQINDGTTNNNSDLFNTFISERNNTWDVDESEYKNTSRRDTTASFGQINCSWDTTKQEKLTPHLGSLDEAFHFEDENSNLSVPSIFSPDDHANEIHSVSPWSDENVSVYSNQNKLPTNQAQQINTASMMCDERNTQVEQKTTGQMCDKSIQDSDIDSLLNDLESGLQDSSSNTNTRHQPQVIISTCDDSTPKQNTTQNVLTVENTEISNANQNRDDSLFRIQALSSCYSDECDIISTQDQVSVWNDESESELQFDSDNDDVFAGEQCP